jgi:ATP-GRASP peptide maturase of grasp-with-spasm system
MVIINKYNEIDYSTELIINWLNVNKTKYTIINYNEINESFEILKNINKHKFLKIWNWRSITGQSNVSKNSMFYNYFNNESRTLLDYSFTKLEHKSIWYPKKKSKLNKLTVLDFCSKIGLKTPKTIVTTSKSKLLTFRKKNLRIISKPIYEVDAWTSRKMTHTLFTTLITDEDINRLPSYFFPSLFQEYIEKDFEIRSFFIDGDFYSMAIFSQSNEKTKIDFRHYDYSLENRTTSFKLPHEIRIKLTILFNMLDLRMGVVDLIYSKKREYYFLELNPVGQFNMISEPCNYYLEKIIADKLSDENVFK